MLIALGNVWQAEQKWQVSEYTLSDMYSIDVRPTYPPYLSTYEYTPLKQHENIHAATILVKI